MVPRSLGELRSSGAWCDNAILVLIVECKHRLMLVPSMKVVFRFRINVLSIVVRENTPFWSSL